MALEAAAKSRERTVLTAIVETYIATGEPVASQALARHFGNQGGHELCDHPQCDGHPGGRRSAGSAAYLRRPHPDAPGISFLCGASERASAGDSGSGATGADRGELCRHRHQRAISRAHLARPGPDLQRPGRRPGRDPGDAYAGAHPFLPAGGLAGCLRC